MILKNSEKEYLVWVLLDFEASIPILNKSWAQNHKIPTSRQAESRLVKNLAAKIEPEIRLACTYPVRLQHRGSFSVESFEIGPTDDECDAILPFWWIAIRALANRLGKPHEFRFEQYRTCTEALAN
jgi:hypothetical protein